MKKLKSLIFSTFVTLTFLAPQKLWGAEKNIDEANHHNVKTIIESNLKTNSDLLNSSIDRDIIVFLGNTGSGKSTLINYLSEKKLKVNSDSYKIELENPNDPSAMVIGGGSESETFLPKFIQANGLLFYDLPGFRDTHGTAKNLVNACFIKRIIENSRSTKLVFVAGIGQITDDRAESFKKLSNTVKQLIPNKSIENFSCLIITKNYLPHPVLLSNIKQSLKPDIDENPDLSTLKFWINNQKLGQMSAPSSSVIDSSQKANIINIIKDMKSFKIENISINAIYDISQEIKIKEIYNSEIQDIIDNLIKQEFDLKELSTKEELENKKNYMLKDFKTSVCWGVTSNGMKSYSKKATDSYLENFGIAI